MQPIKKTIVYILMFTGSLFGFSLSAMSMGFEENKVLAEQGNFYAQSNIGLAYYTGNGVEQDYIQAKKWLEKSAEQGVAGAQYNLGTMYSNGLGVRQDKNKAFEWYKKSAEQDYSDAQVNLGYMYEMGKGVRYDRSQAKEWYGKACDNGNQKGCDNYRLLNQK